MTETLEQRQEKALEHFNRAVSIRLEPKSAETLAAEEMAALSPEEKATAEKKVMIESVVEKMKDAMNAQVVTAEELAAAMIDIIPAPKKSKRRGDFKL